MQFCKSEHIQSVCTFILSSVLCGCLALTGAQVIYPQSDPNYRIELDNAKNFNPEVVEFCRRLGDPVVVEKGLSGWYVAWSEPRLLLNVKNASSTRVHCVIPADLWRYVGPNTQADSTTCIVVQSASGIQRRVRLNGVLGSEYLRYLDNLDKNVESGDAVNDKKSASTENPIYTIERLSRVQGDEFAYQFSIRFNNQGSTGLRGIRTVKQDLRNFIVEDYVSTFPEVKSGNVKISFSEFEMKDSVVEGRAEVMRISVVSLQYDATRRKGVISVKIGANRFEDARKWVRKNIETLAKDKNIALTTGTIPPETHFFLGAERVKEGGVLEIEFETE